MLLQGQDSCGLSVDVLQSPTQRTCSVCPVAQPIPDAVARTAADSVPTLGANRVYPHMLRHSAASHFLHEDVDMVTISRWVGHANLATTCIYAEVDLESKRKAVQAAKPLLSPEAGCAQWRTQADTFGWLESR